MGQSGVGLDVGLTAPAIPGVADDSKGPMVVAVDHIFQNTLRTIAPPPTDRQWSRSSMLRYN